MKLGEQARFDNVRQESLLKSLEETHPSTGEHRIFLDAGFKAIVKQKRDAPGKIILLQGGGGTGKTTTMLKIMAYTRSKGKIVMGCASTSIAAAQYGREHRFNTAHGAFKIGTVKALGKNYVELLGRELPKEVGYSHF